MVFIFFVKIVEPCRRWWSVHVEPCTLIIQFHYLFRLGKYHGTHMAQGMAGEMGQGDQTAMSPGKAHRKGCPSNPHLSTPKSSVATTHLAYNNLAQSLKMG